jgi:predicted metalloprotease
MALVRRSRPLLVATVFAILLAVGCGGDSSSEAGSDTEAVADVMASLNEASRAGDGDRICTQLFTPKLANSVSSSSKSGNCEREVKSNLFSPETRISVENIAVPNESSAVATVKEGNGNTSQVFLVKTGGEWRIRSVVPA